jgi:hypothetical protein
VSFDRQWFVSRMMMIKTMVMMIDHGAANQIVGHSENVSCFIREKERRGWFSVAQNFAHRTVIAHTDDGQTKEGMNE